MKNNNLVINSWFGRTGNNIISLINALFIAVFYNYNLSFPKHSLFNKTKISFDSFNTNVKNHTSYYLFPPLDYYDTILSNNNFDNIYIITEDDNNPIILYI